MTFCRKSMIVKFCYNVNGVPLTRVSRQRDLGLMLDSTLSYNDHIFYVANKSLTVLGQVVRSAKFIFNIHVLKVLFFSLVRLHLDFLSVIYSPYYNCHKLRLERIQNRFLRFAARQLDIPYNFFTHDYSELSSILKIPSVQSRVLKLDLQFFYNILNGNIDCAALLSRISLSVSYISLRNRPSFKVPLSRTNVGNNSPLTQICREVNHAISLDFFENRSSRFKSNLPIYVLNIDLSVTSGTFFSVS